MFCSDVSEGSNTSTVGMTKSVQMTCKAMGGRKYYIGTPETVWPVITFWKKRRQNLFWGNGAKNSKQPFSRLQPLEAVKTAWPLGGGQWWAVHFFHEQGNIASGEKNITFLNNGCYCFVFVLPQHCIYTVHCPLALFPKYPKLQDVTRHQHITYPQVIQQMHMYMNPTHSLTSTCIQTGLISFTEMKTTFW